MPAVPVRTYLNVGNFVVRIRFEQQHDRSVDLFGFHAADNRCQHFLEIVGDHQFVAGVVEAFSFIEV